MLFVSYNSLSWAALKDLTDSNTYTIHDTILKVLILSRDLYILSTSPILLQKEMCLLG